MPPRRGGGGRTKPAMREPPLATGGGGEEREVGPGDFAFPEALEPSVDSDWRAVPAQRADAQHIIEILTEDEEVGEGHEGEFSKNLLRRMHLQGDDMGAAFGLRVAAEASVQRFSVMLFLSTAFLIAELVFGVLSGSLALMADAFHMISDVVAIVCGMWVARVSQRGGSEEMSFGWRRAEVVGAFANGCFLLAVSFTIALDAIEKLLGVAGDSHAALAKNAFSVMVVGLAGVTINLFGMCVFGGHGHSHGGGGHCHAHGSGAHAHEAAPVPLLRGGEKEAHGDAHGDGHGHGYEHGHGHGHAEEEGHGRSHSHEAKEEGHGHSHEAGHGHGDGHGHSHDHGHGDGHGDGHEAEAAPLLPGAPRAGRERRRRAARNLNEWSMFLHVMGDALGSAAVAGSAALIHYSTSPLRFLADPICSLLIVAIILASTLPMLRKSGLILLHASPSLREAAPGGRRALHAALRELPGVLEVHEFHLWQLNQATLVCTAHLVLPAAGAARAGAVVDGAKALLHRFGVHSSTLQVELVQEDDQGLVSTGGASACADLVCSDARCLADACCAVGGATE